MTAELPLEIFLDTLEKLKLPYMIVGSWASGLHGRARATHDVDVVVQFSPQQLRRLSAELGEAFYVPSSVAERLEPGRIINVIHVETGFKVDVVPLRDRPFSREEFTRRITANVLGRARWFATPEDTVLTKLEWRKLGGGHRHFEDALGIVQVQGDALDWAYLRRWATKLGVMEALIRLQGGPNT